MTVARPTFLVGLMGSGKSAVGRRLAADSHAPFCDLDSRVERMFGRSTAQLFARGEPEFRRLERLALRSLVDEPGFAARAVVVATGGGTVMDPGCRAAMTVGIVVFLEVPLPELERRLRAEAGVARPLLGDRDPASVLAAQWAAREAAYRRDAIAIDGTGEPQDVARRIADRLAEEAGT